MCNFRYPNLVTLYLCIYLIWNEEHFTFHLQCKHSGTFANCKYEELSYPKNQKMCDPFLLTLLKMWPHYSQSSCENATPSASYKEVPPETSDVFWSARKIDKNYFFLAFRLVLNQPNHLFFAYSWLCRHCCNLANGGCLLSPFHFMFCRYFLVTSFVRIYPGGNHAQPTYKMTPVRFKPFTIIDFTHLV